VCFFFFFFSLNVFNSAMKELSIQNRTYWARQFEQIFHPAFERRKCRPHSCLIHIHPVCKSRYEFQAMRAMPCKWTPRRLFECRKKFQTLRIQWMSSQCLTASYRNWSKGEYHWLNGKRSIACFCGRCFSLVWNETKRNVSKASVEARDDISGGREAMPSSAYY